MDRSVLVLTLLATLAISSAYGVLLLLPPFIKGVGGTEATYGALTASAAIPTALALGLLVRYPNKVAPHRLLAITSLIYAAAAVAVAFVTGVGPTLVVLGLVLGTAWAAAYTTAPMILSNLVDDRRRATYIGYATGTIQLGFGVGPVLGDALRGEQISYSHVFLVGAGLAVLAALFVIPLGVRLKRVAAPVSHGGGPDGPEAPGGQDGPGNLGGSLMAILRSPAVVPLVMIVLCACLFTAMLSFQTTFALSHGLSFDYFYVTYSVAVIVVRLGVSRLVADSSSDRVVAVTTVGMAIAVAVYFVVGGSAVLYTVASALLGISYGLALPAVQARAVNMARADQRDRMLPTAGLIFEVAILAFPLAAGALIDSVGYQGLFIVLFGFTVVIAILGLIRPRRNRAAATAPTAAPASTDAGPESS